MLARTTSVSHGCLRKEIAILRVFAYFSSATVVTSRIFLVLSSIGLGKLTKSYRHAITGRQHYRLYTIHNIPSLKCLDFAKVKKNERDQAARLANSAAGAALESDLQSATVKTFTPGESEDGASVVTLFTVAEKEAIRNLLSNAVSMKEVEEIENAVKRGVLPQQLLHQNAEEAPGSKRQEIG